MNKMSTLTVSAGPAPSNFSDGGASSSVDQGDQRTRTLNSDRLVRRAFKGTDKVDKRLLQLLEVRQKLQTVN